MQLPCNTLLHTKTTSYENKRKHLVLWPYWHFSFVVSVSGFHFNLEILPKTKFEWKSSTVSNDCAYTCTHISSSLVTDRILLFHCI